MLIYILPFTTPTPTIPRLLIRADVSRADVPINSLQVFIPILMLRNEGDKFRAIRHVSYLIEQDQISLLYEEKISAM